MKQVYHNAFWFCRLDRWQEVAIPRQDSSVCDLVLCGQEGEIDSHQDVHALLLKERTTIIAVPAKFKTA